MARDLIKIKGVSNGFQLMVDSSADLAQVQEELERKLAEHPEFFPEGTKFQLVVADLHKSVRQGLGSYLQSKGLDLADSTKRCQLGQLDRILAMPTLLRLCLSQIAGEMRAIASRS